MRSTKAVLLLCCVAVLGASSVVWGQAGSDWVIQRTNSPPVIDGLGNDAAWSQAAVRGFNEFNNVGAALNGAADLSVFWKGLWDDTNLYLYVEVTDDSIVTDDSCNYEDDSIEFYIDAKNLDVTNFVPAAGTQSLIPAYQFTGIAGNSIETVCGEQRIPEGSTSMFTWGINSYDAPDPFNTEDDITRYPQGADTSVSVIKDANHYTLEVAFPWEALEETPANIKARGAMGLGVAVNDDDDGGGRDTQLMWATTKGDLWQRSDSFPSVSLVESVIPPVYVAGQGTIGTKEYEGTQSNEVYGPPSLGPGLAQEWYAVGNPGSKEGVDIIFEDNEPIVAAFRAVNGASWWTGTDTAFGELAKYPAEVQPPLNGNDNQDYTVRSTGEILIAESGTYRFTDGVDDFTYLAIDVDQSGVAGDDPTEILINDNNWTNVLRSGNNGGGGLAETEITVNAGGEWLKIEFNMAEGNGGDAGVIYWDYNPDAPAGQRLGGGQGFPNEVTDPITAANAESLVIPDTHLRGIGRVLASADRKAKVISDRPLEFDVNGTTDTADQLAVDEPYANVNYKTILDVDGITFQIASIGPLANGDTFDLINADQILGTPIITSLIPGQVWTWIPATGQIVFGTGGIAGDYNKNGTLDAADLDLQAAAMVAGGPTGTYDLNGDNAVNFADRQKWLHDLKKTWVGDSDLNGLFESADFVLAFQAGKYEVPAAPATWVQGDWNGDKLFTSADFVAAFADGGYEAGPRPGAVSAVPEPSSLVLVLIGLAGLLGVVRRR